MPVSRTTTDVWNQALARIGHTKFIGSTTDTSTEAVLCNLHYTNTVKRCLEDWLWPFARKQVALAEPDGVTRNGWEHVYSLPTDCVTPIALLPEDTKFADLAVGDRIPFEIMSDDDGEGQLLCTNASLDDADFAVLEYVAFIDDVGAWSGMFMDAVAWRLAVELSAALTKKETQADWCMRNYAMAIAAARDHQANTGNRGRDTAPTTPSIAAR